jgi:hypothetical protein
MMWTSINVVLPILPENSVKVVFNKQIASPSLNRAAGCLNSLIIFYQLLSRIGAVMVKFGNILVDSEDMLDEITPIYGIEQISDYHMYWVDVEGARLFISWLKLQVLPCLLII